jgi:hypothetical protein
MLHGRLQGENLFDFYEKLNKFCPKGYRKIPIDFMFLLTKEELDYLKCPNGITNMRGGDRMLSYAFTEHGNDLDSPSCKGSAN